MRSRTRVGVLGLIALIYGTSQGCDDPIDVVGGDYVAKKCLVTVENWTTAQFNAVVSNRDLACPVRLTSNGQLISYNAEAKFVKDRMDLSFYELVVTNALNNSFSQNITHSWHSDNDFDYLQASGSYPAGTAGAQSVQLDKLNNIFHYKCPGITEGCVQDPAKAIVHVTYTYTGGPINFISPPISVMPYETMYVNANISDPTLVPPYTWSWTHNGSPLSYTTDEFWYSTGEMGTQHEFAVVVTDVYGNSVSGSYTVYTKNCTGSPDCLDQ